jgi:AsmA protein
LRSPIRCKAISKKGTRPVKKFLKVLGIVLGIFLLLLIAAVVILPQVVDPNDYKDRIAALVTEQTGRKLKIQGNISLSVFPWLGVKLGTVELANAPGFEAPVFARIDQLQIRVRILPLLSKRVEADVVTVRGLTINLERNKNGQDNWRDLLKAAPEKKSGKGGPEPSMAGALMIGGVDVRDASVTWADQTSGNRFALTNLSFKTSEVTLVNPVDVKTGFDVDTGAVGLKGRVESSARLTLDMKNNVYKLDDLLFSAGLKGKPLPGGGVTIKGNGAMAFDAGAQRFELGRLKLEAGGLSLPPYTAAVVVETDGNGDLGAQTLNLPDFKLAMTMAGGEDRISASLTGNIRADLKAQKVTVSDLAFTVPEASAKGTRVRLSTPQNASAKVDLSEKTFLLEGLKITGTVSGKTLPGGSLPVALSLGVRGDLNRQKVIIDPLQLETLGIKAVGNLSAERSQDVPLVNGSLTVDRFSPRDLLSRMGLGLPKISDPKALTSAELALSFAATPNSVKVDKLAARLDDSRVTGSAAVNSFVSPDARFDLAVDRINLDRYLPAEKTGGASPASAATPGTGVVGAAGLPLDSLRKLSLNGTLRISDLVASGAKMGNIVVGIRAKEGLIRTDPVTANLYEGSYTGAVELDVRGPEPKISFSEKLAGVHLERVLKELHVDAGKAYLGGPSTLTLKGSVGADAALRVIRVDRLTADGTLGGKLLFGLDGGGTLLNLNDQTLTAERLRVNVGGLNLQIKTKVTSLSTKPSFTADISAPAFNLRQLLAKIGRPISETADPSTMTVAELTASVKGSTDAVSVEPLKLRLDDSRLEGKLGINLEPSPAYVFDIRVDDIDMDRYLPGPKKAVKPASHKGTGTPQPAVALPFDTLRALNLEGKLAVAKLKIANLRLQDAQLQVRGKDGVVTLDPLRGALYGGTIGGKVSVDATGKQPRLGLEQKLANVQAGGLLKDFQGRAMLSGLTTADAKISAVGANADAITRTLSGTVGFRLTDGSIEGVDIIGKVCRALSAYRAGSFKKEDIVAGVLQMVTPKAKGGEQKSADHTEFSEMGGSVVFTNGVGTNSDLVVKSPLLRLEGSGKLDLPKERLDYQATVALVESCEGQGGKSFQDLAGYPVPVTISGPLNNLDVKPNLTAGILQILERRQAKENQTPATQQQQPSSNRGVTSSPPSQTQQPQQQKSPKKQVEESVKDLLQNLLKK